MKHALSINKINFTSSLQSFGENVNIVQVGQNFFWGAYNQYNVIFVNSLIEIISYIVQKWL